MLPVLDSSQLAFRKLQRKFFGASNYANENTNKWSQNWWHQKQKKLFFLWKPKTEDTDQYCLLITFANHIFLNRSSQEFWKQSDIHFGFPFYTCCIKFGINRICRISTIYGCSFDCHFVNITNLAFQYLIWISVHVDNLRATKLLLEINSGIR